MSSYIVTAGSSLRCLQAKIDPVVISEDGTQAKFQWCADIQYINLRPVVTGYFAIQFFDGILKQNTHKIQIL